MREQQSKGHGYEHDEDATTAYASSIDSIRYDPCRVLRTLGLGAAGIAGTLTGFGSSALANPPADGPAAAIDVYPTGQFPIDVAEVNAAVNGGTGPSGRSYDGGGIVRLKARNVAGAPMYFNFGDGPYDMLPRQRDGINITKDVIIVGERIDDGAIALPSGPVDDPDFIPDRTVIYGGRRPFGCKGTNPTTTTLAVRNLYFSGPMVQAVQVGKTSGLEVSDCVICDVISGLVDSGAFSAAVGIEATGLGTGYWNLSGDFKALNNRIRRADPASFAYNPNDTGIVVQLAQMDAHILANEVSQFAFQGIGIDRNQGQATISRNRVSKCGYGGSPLSGSIGLRGTYAPTIVDRNDISCGECAPSLLSKNGIVLASGKVVVRSNAIDGVVASDGIRLATFAAAGSSYVSLDNTIERNRLNMLVAGHAQAFIEAGCHSNTFVENLYGDVETHGAEGAGIVVAGTANQFDGDILPATYPGTTAAAPLPCVWLQSASSGNAVAFKYQGRLDACTQTVDQGVGNYVEGFTGSC